MLSQHVHICRNVRIPAVCLGAFFQLCLMLRISRINRKMKCWRNYLDKEYLKYKYITLVFSRFHLRIFPSCSCRPQRSYWKQPISVLRNTLRATSAAYSTCHSLSTAWHNNKISWLSCHHTASGYFSLYLTPITDIQLGAWGACATSRTVLGSFPGGVTGLFSDISPSDRTMALGSI
jgi:hypothetical protein